MTQTFNNEIPYEVDVLVTVDNVLHRVRADLTIDFTAERWDESDGWDISYVIRFNKLEMQNVETEEEIILVKDAEKSVRNFVENYIRNGSSGLHDSDVIYKCAEVIREDELYGYEEQH